MVKRIVTAALAASMFVSSVPVIHASDNIGVCGFEEGEEAWIVNSTDGRISSGYDSYLKHNGKRSYKFEAVTLTSVESEYASIVKTFDISGDSAYRVGLYYLLSEDYTRLDANKGGAVFTYTQIDKNGAEIPGASYEYYYSSKEYAEGEYDPVWQGNNFYIVPADGAVKCKITIGLRAATGQVNFDDITIDKISKSEVLSNPVNRTQLSDENIRDSYEVGWEGDDANWWRTTLGSAAVAEVGVTNSDAHSGTSSFMFKADTMNVTPDNNQADYKQQL